MTQELFKELNERGYTYQLTHDTEIKNLLNGKKQFTFYLGIDPTADSLHIGHFFALMMFKKLQKAGHKGILVIGGATALIGDPSGKKEMRKMITKEEVKHNIAEVEKIARRFISTEGENPAIILNNSDWINKYSYIDFMRDIGMHFNVAVMLKADAYKNRIEEGGLTFLEMGYMLMQAYDFAYLNKKYGCVLQIGGSDQWGNIVAGVNLNRKLNNLDSEIENNSEIYGITCPLLMTRDGKKMGKTESGTLWVAREKTTIFDFYQYFFNVHDDSTEMLLKLFTEIDLKTINKLLSEDIVKAKRVMAYEITKLVHGKEEADKVVETVLSLFENSQSSENAPTFDISVDLLKKGISVIDLFVHCKMVDSKSACRSLLKQGGLKINNEKIDNENLIVTDKFLNEGKIILKKGKKNFLQLIPIEQKN